MTGVRTDRPGGDIRARVVIACDGVNSFLAKEAGLLPRTASAHTTLGVKETLALPREVIDERFAADRRPGPGHRDGRLHERDPRRRLPLHRLDTVSVGVVVGADGLAAAKMRPEELIADLKAHPAIAPYLRGAELKEYSAHLIPEGGYRAMPQLAIDGMLVAGDAAFMCLAAGLWLEGVNFAIGAGLAAGRAAAKAIAAGDTSAAGLAGYRRRAGGRFVLADHKRLRDAPRLVLADRMQQGYPGLACDFVEQMFTVTNPEPKLGMARLSRRSAKRNGVRLRPAPGLAGRRAGIPMRERDDGYPETSFDERMGTVEFRVGERAHIIVDSDVCRSCTTQACVHACPAACSCPPPTAASCSTTSSASSAAPAIRCATARGPSPGLTPAAATASCSGRGDDGGR